jgi:hypothetical protein
MLNGSQRKGGKVLDEMIFLSFSEEWNVLLKRVTRF